MTNEPRATIRRTGGRIVKRFASVLSVVSATWLTLTLFTPAATSVAAVNAANASIPVDPATTLEVHATANCVTAEANCFFKVSANLLRPEGPVGFPNDLWGRQTTTLRTSHRDVYVDSDFDAPNTRMFKSITDVEFTTIYFGGGPVEKYQLNGNSWLVDWSTGLPRTDSDYIVCTHIQVVYAGVNLTSPDACAWTDFS
jgi:hypothetical protein